MRSRRLMGSCLLPYASVLMLAVASVAAAATDDTFVIRNADVYPVTAAEIKNVSVLVEDGKIAEIGSKVNVPKHVRVVDGKGLRVYPGMIDSGTELGLSEIPTERVTVDTGELGEFMPQLRALSSVNPSSEHFPVSRANGITSVMTFPTLAGGAGRQLVSGQAALIHLDGWTWEDMALRPTAAMEVIFPIFQSRFGSVTNGEARRTYNQSLVRLRAFFTEARRYQRAKNANSPGFRPDLRLEAMLPVLEGKVPIAVRASREREIRDTINFVRTQQVKAVILQPRELANVAEDLKAADIPVILGRTLSLPEKDDDAYDSSFTLPAEAYKAGVKFAFGTFENQYVRDLPYNAATAVAFGLPYEEALKAVTINAAEIWGVGHETGSIEKGKWADLIVTTGDPLETQTEIKHAYIKGKEVDLSTKQTRLYERYMNRP